MRAVLGILIGLGLIVLVFVLILKGFSGGSNSTKPSIDLVTYAGSNAVAQLVLDGPVNADQDHRTVRISVSQNQTQFELIQGYQGNVIRQQTFPNNQPAFAVFLQALNHQNFTRGDNDPSRQDERGYCPQGSRYIYSLNQGGDTVLRYWSTSCSGQGTFGGNASVVRNLFERQIPGFDDLTSDLSDLNL